MGMGAVNDATMEMAAHYANQAVELKRQLAAAMEIVTALAIDSPWRGNGGEGELSTGEYCEKCGVDRPSPNWSLPMDNREADCLAAHKPDCVWLRAYLMTGGTV